MLYVYVLVHKFNEVILSDPGFQLFVPFLSPISMSKSEHVTYIKVKHSRILFISCDVMVAVSVTNFHFWLI